MRRYVIRGLFLLSVLFNSKSFALDLADSFVAQSFPASISSTLSVRPVATTLNTVWVAAFGSDAIIGYKENADHTLHALNSYATGPGPIWVTSSENGKFLYVANQKGSSITAFGINPDGTLRRIVDQMPVGLLPGHLAVYKNFLYVTCQGSSTVEVYLISGTGLLSQLWSYSLSNTSMRFAVSKNGMGLLTSAGENIVRAYMVDPQTGVVTDTGYSDETDAFADMIAFAHEPNGQEYAYVGNDASATITAYWIGGGFIKNLQSISSNTEPLGLSVSPDNAYVYASSFDNGQILKFARLSNGTLLPPTQVASMSQPGVIGFSKIDGHAAFVGSFDTGLFHRFLINASSGDWFGDVAVSTGVGPYALTSVQTTFAIKSLVDLAILTERADVDSNLSPSLYP